MKLPSHANRRLSFLVETIKKVDHSESSAPVTSFKELEGLSPMRDAKRFEIRCPVTVQVSNGANHKVKVQGVLYDIGVDGARVALEQPVPPGTKITLFAHFRAPEEQVTTIRFEGIVQRLQEAPRFEIAVNFQGTGRFLQKQIVDLHAMKGAGGDEAS